MNECCPGPPFTHHCRWFHCLTLSVYIHTQAAIQSFIKEAARIVKPGGVLCFVDNNPR